MGVKYIITNAPEKIDFEGINSAEARVVQNAKNLLMTRKGEIPFDRQRGFDYSLYSLPMSEFQGILMEELDRIMLWEPYVEVSEAQILRVDEENRVMIQLVTEVADNVV